MFDGTLFYSFSIPNTYKCIYIFFVLKRGDRTYTLCLNSKEVKRLGSTNSKESQLTSICGQFKSKTLHERQQCKGKISYWSNIYTHTKLTFSTCFWNLISWCVRRLTPSKLKGRSTPWILKTRPSFDKKTRKLWIWWC